MVTVEEKVWEIEKKHGRLFDESPRVQK